MSFDARNHVLWVDIPDELLGSILAGILRTSISVQALSVLRDDNSAEWSPHLIQFPLAIYSLQLVCRHWTSLLFRFVDEFTLSSILSMRDIRVSIFLRRCSRFNIAEYICSFNRVSEFVFSHGYNPRVLSDNVNTNFNLINIKLTYQTSLANTLVCNRKYPNTYREIFGRTMELYQDDIIEALKLAHIVESAQGVSHFVPTKYFSSADAAKSFLAYVPLSLVYCNHLDFFTTLIKAQLLPWDACDLAALPAAFYYKHLPLMNFYSSILNSILNSNDLILNRGPNFVQNELRFNNSSLSVQATNTNSSTYSPSSSYLLDGFGPVGYSQSQPSAPAKSLRQNLDIFASKIHDFRMYEIFEVFAYQGNITQLTQLFSNPNLINTLFPLSRTVFFSRVLSASSFGRQLETFLFVLDISKQNNIIPLHDAISTRTFAFMVLYLIPQDDHIRDLESLKKIVQDSKSVQESSFDLHSIIYRHMYLTRTRMIEMRFELWNAVISRHFPNMLRNMLSILTDLLPNDLLLKKFGQALRRTVAENDVTIASIALDYCFKWRDQIEIDFYNLLYYVHSDEMLSLLVSSPLQDEKAVNLREFFLNFAKALSEPDSYFLLANFYSNFMEDNTIPSSFQQKECDNAPTHRVRYETAFDYFSNNIRSIMKSILNYFEDVLEDEHSYFEILSGLSIGVTKRNQSIIYRFLQEPRMAARWHKQLKFVSNIQNFVDKERFNDSLNLFVVLIFRVPMYINIMSREHSFLYSGLNYHTTGRDIIRNVNFSLINSHYFKYRQTPSAFLLLDDDSYRDYDYTLSPSDGDIPLDDILITLVQRKLYLAVYHILKWKVFHSHVYHDLDSPFQHNFRFPENFYTQSVDIDLLELFNTLAPILVQYRKETKFHLPLKMSVAILICHPKFSESQVDSEMLSLVETRLGRD